MRYLFPTLATLFTFLYFVGRYSTPIFNDEISPYYLPAIHLLDGEWHRLYAFQPQYFFGHPPLFSTLYALLLSIFPSNLMTLRTISLLLTTLGLFPMYEIGRTLLGRWGGLVMMALLMGHFVYWENANLMLPDSFFNSLFLCFILAYIKKWPRLLVVLGLTMIVTRETAIIPLTAFWLHSLLIDRSNLKSSSVLLTLQCGWFIYLKATTRSLMPVYYEQGFIFEWDFFTKTLLGIMYEIYIESAWLIIFGLMIFFVLKNRMRPQLWYLPLIGLTTLLGLSLITFSLGRYQAFALSAMIIFVTYHIWQQGLWAKKIFSALTVVLLFWNLYVSHEKINHELHNPFVRYWSVHRSCADRVLGLKWDGTWTLMPFPLSQMARYKDPLENFTFKGADLSIQTISPNQLTHIDTDFFVFAGNPIETSPYARRMLKFVQDSKDFEPYSQEDGCLIFRKRS